MAARRAAILVLMTATVVCALGGCKSSKGGPQALLDKFFSSAVRQDYATTYACYYKRYQDKVAKDEFIKHRKEASVLEKYRIESVAQSGDSAQAVAKLTFASSEKLHRSAPVEVKVTEDLVREDGEWRIKVWN